ncbi:hypothetical protein [Planotetraspora silvatica]|uniref:hypothetical protein n=1 Tax=Planotetraspora silvatica TaxID=234614 RepID=UPI0019500E54|nr:hypothetical protein [Planotetraspora silvatica]
MPGKIHVVVRTVHHPVLLLVRTARPPPRRHGREGYRHRAAHFEIQPGGARKENERFEAANGRNGRFVFDRPHNRLIVSWV